MTIPQLQIERLQGFILLMPAQIISQVMSNLHISSQCLARNASQYPLHNVTARHNESHIQVDKSMLKKKQNSEDETPQYEYKGPSNQYIHQMLVDLQRRSKSIVKEFCLVKKYNKLRTNIDNAFKNKLPTWLVEAKGPLAINTDSIILIVILLAASLFYALKIEVLFDVITLCIERF